MAAPTRNGVEVFDAVIAAAKSMPGMDDRDVARVKDVLHSVGLMWRCATCDQRLDPLERTTCHDQIAVRAEDTRPGDLLGIRMRGPDKVIETARFLKRRDHQTAKVRMETGEKAGQEVLVVSRVGSYHSVPGVLAAENRARAALMERIVAVMEASRVERKKNVDARFKFPVPSSGVFDDGEPEW